MINFIEIMTAPLHLKASRTVRKNYSKITNVFKKLTKTASKLSHLEDCLNNSYIPPMFRIRNK
jgi:ferritin